MVGFRVYCLRDNTIGLEQVADHVPLTTIADEVVGEMIDKSIIQREVSVLDR